MPQNRTILTRKRDLLANSRTSLKDIASSIQAIYWREISKIIEKLELDDSGRVIENDFNLKLIDELQRIYMKLQNEQMPKITDKVQRDFSRMNNLDDQYFRTIVDKDSMGFKKGKSFSETLRRQSLGITKAKNLKPAGFLAALIGDTLPAQGITSILLSGILANKTIKALTREMDVAINGTDTASGITEKQLNVVVFDAYHQFDRATSQARADNIGLFSAVYENNLVEDSRCFCRNRFNQVWTDKEIASWEASSNPEKTREGANCLAIFTTADYDPFIQQGGWNCRHYYRWITSEQAIRRRPELKAFYDNLAKKGVDFI